MSKKQRPDARSKSPSAHAPANEPNRARAASHGLVRMVAGHLLTVLVTGAVVLYSGVLNKGLDVLEENVTLKTQLEVQSKEVAELRENARQLEQLRKLSKIADLTAGDYWYYREIDPRGEKGRVLPIGLCPDHPDGPCVHAAARG